MTQTQSPGHEASAATGTHRGGIGAGGRVPAMRPCLVSAPFGNYIQPAGTTATLGTFTAAARPGRVGRIIKTVRYSPTTKAWVNKIGLRNPGMGWLVEKVRAGKVDASDKLVSVHGFTPDDWSQLLKQITEVKPAGVELNMSCPNVGEINWPATLFADAMATGVPVVVKLPPVCFEGQAQAAFDAGVRAFHCTNTLPVHRGGLSGAPLKPIALAVVRALRKTFGPDVTIVGGGGIQRPEHIDEFADAGADHVALGTVTMNPILLLTHRPLRKFVERADAKLSR